VTSARTEDGPTRLLIAVSVSLMLIAGSRRAAAQTSNGAPPIRAEWWGALSGSVSGPSGTLVSSYSPPLLFDGDLTSDAAQTLTANAGGLSVGVMAGMNVFPSRRVGLQVLFERVSYNLSGSNGPYDVNLHYVSRLPPNNEPQPVDIHQSVPWPDTSGSLTQMVVAVNAVARIEGSDRISVDIAGGPAIYRFTGDLQPIAYTGFNLGGHSVLFENTYRLGGSIEPSYAIGFNAGASVDVAVGAHAAITFGYRYFGGSDVDVSVRLTTILNPEEIGIQQSVVDIASRLSLGAMRTSPSSSRFIVGVKITR